MLRLLPLGVAATLAVAQTPATTAEVPAAAAAEEVATAAAPTPAADTEAGAAAPLPPPSTYDLEARGETTEEDKRPEEISWGAQLIKTVLALGLVVGLIYLVFKVGLVRLLGYATVARGSGKALSVVERVQLDARHALYLIEVDGGERLLLGTGERGVQVLSTVDPDGKLKRSEASTTFGTVLSKTSAEADMDGEADDVSS